jgi:aryl-alcohol dehydrogenase-like predicted oxidoreductase
LEHRPIGTSDLRASVVGLGCNNFGGRLDEAASRPVIDKAIDLGVSFFDTSDSYGNRGGSETVLGNVLGPRRKQIVLATKFGWPMDDEGKKKGASRAYVFQALEASLSRLKTDWIDLYQLHVPDPATPIEETFEALEQLVRDGKIRYYGCSNFSAEGVAAAQAKAREMGVRGFVTSQDHYNLLSREIETDMIPELRRQDMSLLPFAPLANGLLTGKYRKDAPMPQNTRVANSPRQAERYLGGEGWRVIEDLVAFSARRGHTLLELAFAWVAAQDPVCSVIAGAMTPEQVAANVAAIGWRLSGEELAEIEKITTVEA